MLKRNQRLFLICLLLVNVIFAGAVIYSALNQSSLTSKLIQTLGLLVGLTGVVQIAISDFFNAIIHQLNELDDCNKGLPSVLIRQVIDNPDRPIKTKIRNLLFFNPKTGFWIVCISFLVEIVGVWY